MSDSNYSFFGAVEKSFDRAAKFTTWDPGILEQIKQCNSVYRMHFPVKIGDKICRVATTHLQSMHLTRATNIPIGQELWQDSMVINHGNMIEKLKYFQPYHAMQANYLRSFLDTCKMPLIFTADLNSVPSSYVYKKVRGNLADAFLAKGLGFGRSYHSLQPALRIDYIFYNGAINNVQTSLFHTTFSDHDPVLMDFYIP